ncbi:MAG: NHLP leader peptide family RiPP precursor [Rubrobacteraceae bacterium]
MAEASSGGSEEIRQRLVQRTMEDEELRQRLLNNPKVTIEQEIGAHLPEGLEIRAVEETQDTVYLVLPFKPQSPSEGSELSERELATVAGGWDPTAGGDTCGDNYNTCAWACSLKRLV